MTNARRGVSLDSLPAAAAIMASGVKIAEVIPHSTERGLALFHFTDSRASDLAGRYFTDQLTVNPRAFMRAFDSLRDEVKDLREGVRHERIR